MPRATNRQDSNPDHSTKQTFLLQPLIFSSATEGRKAKIAQVVVTNTRNDADDEDGTAAGNVASIYKLCVRAEGPDKVIKFTHFAPEEFERLWETVSLHAKGPWNVGRGNKCRYAARDVFFMTLSSLKHLGKWDTVARVFKVTPSTFQKMVRKFMDVISPFLYETFVEEANDWWTLGSIVRSGYAFHNFPYARYATDVTFQNLTNLAEI